MLYCNSYYLYTRPQSHLALIASTTAEDLAMLNNDKLYVSAKVDHAAQVKAEKIKLALEKIKEANVKKLFLKAFSRDGSSKSLLVDEKMTVAHVTRLLADKNHVTMDPKWTIVEHLPDLYMGMFFISRLFSSFIIYCQ